MAKKRVTRKPKPEEILKNYPYQRDDDREIWYSDCDVISAMQEYAELYHKENLREELIKFAEWYDGDIIPKEPFVEKYLK